MRSICDLLRREKVNGEKEEIYVWREREGEKEIGNDEVSARVREMCIG